MHEYDYDQLGRLTQDRVTAVGLGIENRVLRVRQTYEVRGMLQTVTNYSNATVGSGWVLSEVKFVYNDFGQLETEYQDHDAVVNVQTTPKVGYSYANGSNNHVRRTKLTYPNGRELNFNYGDGGSAADNLGRVAALIDDDGSTHLADYEYLGAVGVSKVDLAQPDLKLDLDHGTPRAYAALDALGRIVDHRWVDYGPTPDVDAVRIGHGYDRAGNRLYREDSVAAANSVNLDELYDYDGVYQLTDLDRGNLNANKDGLVAQTKNFAEQWSLDPTGNWNAFKQDTDGDDDWDLDQTRSHNKSNELTQIAGSGVHVSHDRAGNMRKIPKPDDWAAHYDLTYDAWNRLVEVNHNGVLVAGYEYDGLNRRTLKEVYISGSLEEVRYFYYSDQWQVLEERVEDNYYGSSSSAAGTPTVDIQYVWGLRYVDDLVLRDRDTSDPKNGVLNERLYALQDANWNV